MATVVGTFLGGPLTEALGYKIVLLFAVVGLVVAAALVRSAGRTR
jgi:predicted MFS family arabinose efflux permease